MVTERRRGAALFVVLLFSAFLAGLAATAWRTSLSGTRAATAFADLVRADELGRGAAAALAYRLATGDEAAKRGGAIGLRWPGADVTIDYVSESARVDVNLAPVSLIAALVVASGGEEREAEAVAARVTQFRSEAAARAGATAGAGPGSGTDKASAAGGLAALRASIDALGPAAKPKTGPQVIAIHDTAEVAEDWGLTDAVARRLLPSLTVSSGAATVDPVLAGRPVLLALLGGDERVDDYIGRRHQGFTDKESALALIPVPARDFVAFNDAKAIRAVVRVKLANGFERRYEMVLAPSATADVEPAKPAPEGTPPPPRRERGAVPILVSWRKLP